MRRNLSRTVNCEVISKQEVIPKMAEIPPDRFDRIFNETRKFIKLWYQENKANIERYRSADNYNPTSERLTGLFIFEKKIKRRYCHLKHIQRKKMRNLQRRGKNYRCYNEYITKELVNFNEDMARIHIGWRRYNNAHKRPNREVKNNMDVLVEELSNFVVSENSTLSTNSNRPNNNSSIKHNQVVEYRPNMFSSRPNQCNRPNDAVGQSNFYQCYDTLNDVSSQLATLSVD